MDRIILHIDFDSFFASCEQQFNPEFRNRPIGVTATNGRTCIIAASKEAKRFGIKTGSRTFDAEILCPRIVFTPARFDKYWEISQKFISICKDFTPTTEIFSLDEVFMDITKTHNLFGGVDCLISRIKKRIRKEIGEYITVSIGISHNKMLAKLASGLKKPNGIVEIGFKDIERVYGNAKLTDICGIGERIKIRLNAIGIHTLLELKSTPLAYLIQEFGKVEGNFLKRVGLGIDDTSVIPYTDPLDVKSVGRNFCMAHNQYDFKIVLQNIYELCEEIGIKLRRLKKMSKTVGIGLRGNFNIFERKTYGYYFDSGRDIFKACHSLITPLPRIILGEDRYVRQISVWVSNLEDKNGIQLSLFEDRYKKDKLTQTIDVINDRFGDHTIRNAFLLYADKLTTKPNGYMADKYEREKVRYAF